MPDDAHISTHAKVCALEIVTHLQAHCGLPLLDTSDLYTIAARIDQAITDASNLQRVLRDAGIRQP